MNFSCHDLVETVLSIPDSDVHRDKATLHTSTYTEFDRVKINWEKSEISHFQDKAGSLLSQAEDCFTGSQYIPLKCELYSKLLVNAATSTCSAMSSLKFKAKSKISSKVKAAKSIYKRKYKAWNQQNRCREHPSFLEYTSARKNLQSLVRYENNLKNIRFNNTLMHAHSQDKNKVYSLMKKSRGVQSYPETTILETPVGCYYGQDILEGFTADAEFLGRAEGECEGYDNHFYRMCIIDKYCILEFKDDKAIKIPHMNMSDLESILHSK